MAEVRYLISDAAKQVDVESHVLRYWEDELELQIPRNEMGHRYYTDYYVRLFRQIKDLKEKGYQLKAIKNALNKMAGAMEDIIITEDYMEEDMKAAWKESRRRERQMKERAQKKAAEAARREQMKECAEEEYGWNPDGEEMGGQARMAADDQRSGAGGDLMSGGAGGHSGWAADEPLSKAPSIQVEEQIVRLQERLQEMRAREAEAALEQEAGRLGGNDARMGLASEVDTDSGLKDNLDREDNQTEPMQELQAIQISTEKMAQFQTLMNHVIGQAMEVNMDRISRELTEEISETICETVSDTVSDQVTDRVMKEVEYLMRVSDEREEERFKQLDETIRAYQKKGKGRAEAAATKIPFFRKKRFGKSGKRLL